MPHTKLHKQYVKFVNNWLLVRDAVEGAFAVKARPDVGDSRTNNSRQMLALAGTRYLPPPNASDASNENIQRYTAYLKRANFANFTAHTKEGFVGMVFRQDMTVDLPAQVEYLKENANGAGLTIDQLTRGTIGEVLEAGRYGYLTDYPITPQGLTVAKVQALGLKANILTYQAESIINWRTTVVNGTRKLTLVVLREEVEKIEPDGFTTKEDFQFRILRLTEGTYTQEIRDAEGTLLADQVAPRKADGTFWAEIPFTFIGTQNNDPDVDKSCLYDIAEVNLAHYRNSADYEESSFMVGQPTPWASGLTQTWVDSNMKNGLMIGSRTVVLLPEGGAFGLAQADPNQMPQKGMQDKEEQLVKLGANIIRDTSGNLRVDQVKMQFSGKTSKLSTLVGNVESALIKSINWALEFMGGDGADVVIEINRQFFDQSLDPQAVMASIALVDRGIIANTDIRAKLRKTGLIAPDRTDEDIDADVGVADPLA